MLEHESATLSLNASPNPSPLFPGCAATGHCKNLKADWEKSASALKGVVGVAAVDATESKALASKYGIQVCVHTPGYSYV